MVVAHATLHHLPPSELEPLVLVASEATTESKRKKTMSQWHTSEQWEEQQEDAEAKHDSVQPSSQEQSKSDNVNSTEWFAKRHQSSL